MTQSDVPLWLSWAREIQAMGQTGLTYSATDYDTQRYQRLVEIAAEMVAHQTELAREPVLERFSIQPGYATAKVDVRGAVVQDGAILLVQERGDGRWCMPGGWADVGDMPSETVAREVLEESGYRVEPRKIVGVYDANRDGRPLEFFHAYKIVFLCDIVGGAPRLSNETAAVDFFDFDDLPPLSSSRTNERHLEDVRAHVEDQSRPAVFD